MVEKNKNRGTGTFWPKSTRPQRQTLRNVFISVFVILWIFLFHYESIRHFYLNPLFKTQLPKVKFLFPPAGWIMFFKVDDVFGYTQVYGEKGGVRVPIDPHLIFQTRTIGFDNIRRNILSGVLYEQRRDAFGNYLKRKFPQYDSFLITYVQYPSLTKQPQQRYERAVYQVR